MKTFMTAYVWDLERDGLDSALSRLAGDIGVDSVCVHAVTVPQALLYRVDAGGLRLFEHEDGACFQPDATLYSGTRLRPHVLSWMKQRNALDVISRAAERHRLALRLRISCCFSPSLARRNAMLARVSLLGAGSSSWLCPAHPAVREYLAAIAEDLCKNYAPAALELASLSHSDLPAFDVLHSGADLSPASGLLNMCFCAACRERAAAGIDVQAFTARAEKMLGALFVPDPGVHAEFADWFENDPACAAYRQVATDLVPFTLNAIRQRATCEVWEVSRPRDDESDAGLDCVVLDPAGARIPVYRAWPPHTSDGPALVSRVHQAALAGQPLVGFADYGLLSGHSLDWIRQAIRYARRESPDKKRL